MTRPRSHPVYFTAILFAMAIFFLFPVIHESTPTFTQDVDEFQLGVQQCITIRSKAVKEASVDRENPRAVPGTPPVLIKNATLIDGDGQIFPGQNIYVEDGIIKSLEGSETPGCKSFDAHGQYVSPGLVDMHSHIGIMGKYWANNDGNEASKLITSQVRTIDGIDVRDEMLLRAASGGVTSSLLLPGSANSIGGEGFVLKTRKPSTNSVEDMLVQANISEKRQRWLKMACGENPKRVHPTEADTRIGEAWAVRHRFDEAKSLLKAQDNWCEKASAGRKAIGGKPFPSDLELESIVAVLRGDVKVNIHCYTPVDLETQMRISQEFGYEIAAFHHATEAWQVPEMIKRAPNNITIAMFGTQWGYKLEAFHPSVHAGKILADHKIPVAYKSDATVTNPQNLIFQAQLGCHYGLSDELSFAAVTSTPAHALGLDHRIGYARVGYDADLVLWDKHPLLISAKPQQVWIDGVAMFDLKQVQQSDRTLPNKHPNRAENCKEGVQNIVIQGLSKIHGAEGEASVAVIHGGELICTGSSDACAEHIQPDAESIIVENGFLVPGITTFSVALGLSEIESETSTMDNAASNLTFAEDGLFFGGKHMTRAREMGVLDVVTAPTGSGMMQGVSVAFKTTAKNILEKNAITKSAVALHIAIGHDALGDGAKSIASQIGQLRSDLSNPSGIYEQVANGSLPLVVSVDKADQIAQLIRLKEQYGFKLIIHGGIEAYLIASELAAAHVPVLLNHHRCTPETWDSARCLAGRPLTERTNLQLLKEASVDVAIVAYDDGALGELYWEAGWAALDAGLSEDEAIGLVSHDVQRILGIESKAFVVYQGNPLQFGSTLAFTFDGSVKWCAS